VEMVGVEVTDFMQAFTRAFHANSGASP
jgi:hypothetical protein